VADFGAKPNAIKSPRKKRMNDPLDDPRSPDSIGAGPAAH